MRHFIRTITHVDNHDDLVFTKTMEEGWNWETEEKARQYLLWTDPSGRTLARSPLNGASSVCTDFRVEPRPDGRYVISCNLNLN